MARGIGRVLQAVRFRGRAELRVDDAGLDHRAPVVAVDVEDAVQPREHEQHGAFVRERTAGEPGAGAARHERHAERGEEPHHRDHLFASSGKNDEVRNPAVRRQTVHRVREALSARLAHVALTNDGGEIAGQG